MKDIVINFNIPKEKAIKLAKKESTSKFGMAKDSGDYFEVGTKSIPPMIATIKVNDNSIVINAKGLGGQVASTCATAIKLALEEAEENASTSPNSSNNAPQNPSVSLDDKKKAFELLRELKSLKDDGIITEEEFEEQKKQLLGGNINSIKAEPKEDKHVETNQNSNVVENNNIVLEEEEKPQVEEDEPKEEVNDVVEKENDKGLEAEEDQQEVVLEDNSEETNSDNPVQEEQPVEEPRKRRLTFTDVAGPIIAGLIIITAIVLMILAFANRLH